MIQFVKNPTGQYLLAYDVGGTAELSASIEKELIDKGYAIEIYQETIESNARGLQPDDSSASPRKASTKNRKR